MNYIEIKPRINKNNKQITLSLPKKQLSKKLVSNILSHEKIRIKIEE